MDTSPSAQIAAIGRTLLGSFLSALAGWAALAAVPLGAFFLRANDHSGSELWNFIAVAVFATFFILPIWLVALLPLYCLVPQRSVLWLWPVCTFCGAAAGGAIMLVLCAMLPGHLVDSLPLVGLAALVGAVACLFGSRTRGFFRFPAGA